MTNQAVLNQKVYAPAHKIMHPSLMERFKNYYKENQKMILVGLASLSGTTTGLEMYRLFND